MLAQANRLEVEYDGTKGFGGSRTTWNSIVILDVQNAECSDVTHRVTDTNRRMTVDPTTASRGGVRLRSVGCRRAYVSLLRSAMHSISSQGLCECKSAARVTDLRRNSRTVRACNSKIAPQRHNSLICHPNPQTCVTNLQTRGFPLPIDLIQRVESCSGKPRQTKTAVK